MDTGNDGAARVRRTAAATSSPSIAARGRSVCGLGMNPAIAYLVLARGTGGDNRTTKWSANAIEQRTGISRSRAAKAIADLERAKAVVRDPASKRDRPKYKIAPAHEIPGCEGFPPPPLSPERQRVLDRLGDGWTAVPKASRRGSRKAGSRTGRPCRRARSPAANSCGLGRRGSAWQDGVHYRAVPAPTTPRPRRSPTGSGCRTRWWMAPPARPRPSNSCARPAAPRRSACWWTSTGRRTSTRTAASTSAASGRTTRGTRSASGGPYVVWGFVPGTERAWPDAPFVAPHLDRREERGGAGQGWKEFWACWDRLRDLGLVEMVAHLVHADTAEGEIIHPMALDGTGLEVEREVARAAMRAGLAMITPGQREWAMKQGVVALAPVLRHIEGVQMLGIARLRYRPRTSRTLAFVGHGERWRRKIAELAGLADAAERGGNNRAQAGRVHLQHQGRARSRQGSGVLVRAPRFL